MFDHKIIWPQKHTSLQLYYVSPIWTFTISLWTCLFQRILIICFHHVWQKNTSFLLYHFGPRRTLTISLWPCLSPKNIVHFILTMFDPEEYSPFHSDHVCSRRILTIPLLTCLYMKKYILTMFAPETFWPGLFNRVCTSGILIFSLRQLLSQAKGDHFILTMLVSTKILTFSLRTCLYKKNSVI